MSDNRKDFGDFEEVHEEDAAAKERQEKKDKILGKTKKKKNFILPLVIVAAIGLMSVAFMSNLKGSGGLDKDNKGTYYITEEVDYRGKSFQPTMIEPKFQDGKIILNLDEIKKKNYLKFNIPNQQVVLPDTGTVFDYLPIMAYISPDKRLVIAVSFCEPCDGENFYTEGNQLVCAVCGTRWDLKNLKGLSGGCPNNPPDEVEYKVEGNNVILDEQALRAWKPRPLL